MDKKDLIQTMDIAVIIPIKSTPDMNTFKHTDLYNFFFKSFFKYYNWEHRYTIYLTSTIFIYGIIGPLLASSSGPDTI